MGWLSPVVSPPRFTEAVQWPSSDLDLTHDGFNPPNAYRQLSQITQANRNLEPLDQDRMISIAAFLSTQNPLGYRLIELLVDYTIGEGLTYKASDVVKPVLDEHWNHWVNQWPTKQVSRFREMYRFGEAAWAIFLTRQGGVNLGYIDPANIKRIRPDPYNVEIREWLEQKSRTGVDGGLEDPDPLRIVYKDESDGKTQNRWIVDQKRRPDRKPNGVFFVPINNFLNSTRGRSLLMPCFDWLDLYDSFCFGAAERALSASGDFIWDVELKGMNVTQMKEWLRENPMPTGRSIRVHNENQIWKAVSPQLHAADVSEQARMLRMQAMIALGLPEAWIFSGADTNRSTLANQAMPTLKYLSRLQREARAIMQCLLEFVRDQAILAGRLPSTLSPEDEEITVAASEVSTVDLGQMAVTLKDATAALIVGEDRQYLTHDEAATVYRRVVNEFGEDLPDELPPKTLPAEQMVDQGVPPQAIDALAQAARVTNGTRRLRRELVPAGAEGNRNGR